MTTMPQKNTKNADYSKNDPIIGVLRHPTLLQNIQGLGILPQQAVNITPGEGQIPLHHSNEVNWEALAFPKLYSHGENNLNSHRDITLTPSRSRYLYVHIRLKCVDDRFASDQLDWVEKEAVNSSINIAQRKHFQ